MRGFAPPSPGHGRSPGHRGQPRHDHEPDRILGWTPAGSRQRDAPELLKTNETYQEIVSALSEAERGMTSQRPPAIARSRALELAGHRRPHGPRPGRRAEARE